MSFLNKLKFWKSKEGILSELPDYESPLSFECCLPQKEIIDKLKVINFVGDDKPNILLMDDFPAMVDLLANELKRLPKMNIYKDFNIYAAVGEYAAFQVQQHLEDHKHFEQCFNVALLDITLGGILKGEELDGVDVAINIKKCNHLCQIKFITGHTLNQKNPEIFKFSQKFKKFTKLDIDEKIDIIDATGHDQTIYKHVIGKNDNRIILMHHLISEYYKTLE